MAASLLEGGLRAPDGAECRHVLPSMSGIYQASATEVRNYDDMLLAKTEQLKDKLSDIETVIGIPYYTELSNVVSVCVSLREALAQRKTKALIIILGEFSRSEMIEKLHEAELDGDENDQVQEYVRVVAFWKPAVKFQQKPWSVRAFQRIAAAANGGAGAHLMIVDADIQFNFWELSANSLCNALLAPLGQPDPASLVCLNAPRSFYADDAIVHLWCFLFIYAVYGVRIHQLHGGEFSLHRALNQAIVGDKTLQHRNTYCLQGQLIARTCLAPQYGRIVERKMKGKWHAKITLSKLVTVEASGFCRLDMVTERMFQDAVLLGSAAVKGGTRTRVEHAGSNAVGPDPDPDKQRMSVLAPGPARKELTRALSSFFADFEAAHMSAGQCVSFGDESCIAQIVLPLARRVHEAVKAGQKVDISARECAGAEQFSPSEWADATFELLKLYESSEDAGVRLLMVHANRMVWLCGAIAFMKDNWDSDWQTMHEHMWHVYSPLFRHAYLRLCHSSTVMPPTDDPLLF